MKSQSINLSFDTAAVSRATTTGDRMKYWKATYKSADRGARVQQLLYQQCQQWFGQIGSAEGEEMGDAVSHHAIAFAQQTHWSLDCLLRKGCECDSTWVGLSGACVASPKHVPTYHMDTTHCRQVISWSPPQGPTHQVGTIQWVVPTWYPPSHAPANLKPIGAYSSPSCIPNVTRSLVDNWTGSPWWAPTYLTNTVYQWVLLIVGLSQKIKAPILHLPIMEYLFPITLCVCNRKIN